MLGQAGGHGILADPRRLCAQGEHSQHTPHATEAQAAVLGASALRHELLSPTQHAGARCGMFVCGLQSRQAVETEQRYVCV